MHFHIWSSHYLVLNSFLRPEVTFLIDVIVEIVKGLNHTVLNRRLSMATNIPRPASIKDYNDLNDKIYSLTEELSLYEQCDSVGVVGHVRSGEINFNKAITLLETDVQNRRNNGENVEDIRQIEVYADNLTATGLIQLPQRCDFTTVISRIAFAGDEPVQIKIPSDVDAHVLVLFCGLYSKPITFRVFFSGFPQPDDVILDPSKADNDHKQWVVLFTRGGCEAKSSSRTDTLTDLFERSSRSIIDIIQDNGIYSAMGWDKYNR